jgi:L-fuconolactonase
MIVDTHVHVVARDEERFPLRPSGIGSQWFREHPVTAEEYLDTATSAGVDRAVLVQAHGAYGSDNAYVLDAVTVAPDRYVGVVIVDPADADAPAHLRELAAVPGCRGVRLFGIGATEPLWFDGDAGEALWEVAVELDLRVVATLLTAQLPRLATMLASATPACRWCSTTAGSRTCTTAHRSPLSHRCSRSSTTRACT